MSGSRYKIDAVRLSEDRLKDLMGYIVGRDLAVDVIVARRQADYLQNNFPAATSTVDRWKVMVEHV